MKSFIAASIALLAAVASATPVYVNPTVQFTNDQSGANTNVVVPLGVTKNVANLLHNTPLAKDGTFLATSFFLQANFQGITCALDFPYKEIIISEQNTFARIGYPPVDLVNAHITCTHY